MTADNLVTPIDLRDFVKSLGWSLRQEGLPDRIYLFDNPAFPRRQLVFPMHLTAPDYSESVSRLIEKLAEMLGEQPQALLERAQSIRDDTLRFRVFNEQVGGRSIPLGFASSLIMGTQQLLKTMACTVMWPRIHHPRLALTEALQLIEKSSFGHTEHGSFVLKVSCPIQAIDVQGALDFWGVDDPFVRKVTLALRQGLEQIINAIENDTLDQLVDSLKQNAAPMVSSNLCEAIVQLHDETIDNSLDIGFDWSALRPINTQDALRRPIRIQRDYFGRIENIRRELRLSERHQEDTFVGTVERLDGEMGEDGRRAGDVILALLLQDGECVRARVTLGSDDYQKADKAHMTEGAYMKIVGKLQPGRQPRQLTEASHLELICTAG